MTTCEHLFGVKKTIKLRPWQKRALDHYFALSQRDFLAVVTPGGGKTLWALSVAVQLAKMERLIVVCPTTHIKSQWSEQAKAFGLSLNDLDEYRPGHILTTYQQVAGNPDLFADLVGEMPTLVIFDEIHHASDQNFWGTSILHAFKGAMARLCLTGTAFRSDSDEIPFVTYEDGMCRPDFVYGYGEAAGGNEPICRKLEWPVFDGAVSWRREGEEEQSRRFSDRIHSRDARVRLAASLDPGGGFIRSMFAAADATLREFPGEGGLVLARTHDHAEALAATMGEVSGDAAVCVTCKTPGAGNLIKRFRDGEGRWLVAVRMVSEGVDIPRLRVLCYATNVSKELYFRQAMGRIVRGTGRAICYLPGHAAFLKIVQEMHTERLHCVGEDVAGSRTGCFFPPSEVSFLGSEGRLERTIRLFVGEPREEEMSPVMEAARDAARAKQLARSAARWANDPDYRAKQAARKAARYANDPDYRAKEAARKADPDYRAKTAARQRERRAARLAYDADFRAKEAARLKERDRRRWADPDYRAKQAARSAARWANDPDYRAKQAARKAHLASKQATQP